MKIAILGSSPIALEAALRFHQHGAALTLYADDESFSLFVSQNTPSADYVSELGKSILKQMDLNYDDKSFSWKRWNESYRNPLTDYLKTHQEVKTQEVVSVTKRFLAPGEVIKDRSRFLDLFRIIYKVDPKDFIEEQKETSPETYKRLNDEYINSLADSIEMYQDYDLVFDFRTDLSKASIAASGRALGEGRNLDKVSYGAKALEFAHKVTPGPDMREICLVGSDSLSAEILISLESWIKEPRSMLFIMTTEEEPFKNFFQNADDETKKKLSTLLNYIEEEFENEINSFTQKLREWQELDDFVQVKIPKPAEPIPRLNFFSGHNVTAIDELIDRNRMFVTLEKPEFRDGKKHPENNHLELKTIGVDHILVAHAKKNNKVIIVDQDEPGLFQITPSRPNIKNGWSKDLSLLEGIENEIFKLFTPADTL